MRLRVRVLFMHVLWRVACMIMEVSWKPNGSLITVSWKHYGRSHGSQMTVIKSLTRVLRTSRVRVEEVVTNVSWRSLRGHIMEVSRESHVEV